MKKIAARSSANLTKATFKRRYYDTGYPVLVRNMPAYGDTEHSFEKFMTFFKENQADLEHDACEFYTNGALNESVKSLTEFLAEWNHYQAAGKTISWLVTLLIFQKFKAFVLGQFLFEGLPTQPSLSSSSYGDLFASCREKRGGGIKERRVGMERWKIGGRGNERRGEEVDKRK